MKKVVLSVAVMVCLILFASCEQNEVRSVNDRKNQKENIVPDDMSIDLNGELSSRFLLDTISIETVLNQSVDELYQSEQPLEGKFIGFAFSVEAATNILTLIPTSGNSKPRDNKKCGGSEGDGWTSYGTCHSKSCVKEKSKEAAENMSENLSSGKCMDIRVKRNTFSARVCGRVVDC